MRVDAISPHRLFLIEKVRGKHISETPDVPTYKFGNSTILGPIIIPGPDIIESYQDYKSLSSSDTITEQSDLSDNDVYM